MERVAQSDAVRDGDMAGKMDVLEALWKTLSSPPKGLGDDKEAIGTTWWTDLGQLATLCGVLQTPADPVDHGRGAWSGRSSRSASIVAIGSNCRSIWCPTGNPFRLTRGGAPVGPAP